MSGRRNAKATIINSALSAALLLGTSACAMDGAEDGATDVEDGSDKSSVVTYEAEVRSADYNTIRQSEHQGFTGTGYVNFGRNGSWIEWNNVNVSVSGLYELTFYYASYDTATRPTAVIVNGANAGSLNFAPTGSWRKWFAETVKVPINAGRNTIRIMATTSRGGVNLDRMSLSLSSASSPVEPRPVDDVDVASIPPRSSGASHVDTTVAYDSDGENVRIERPRGTRPGDLLVLALHRTDDLLPLKVSGWTHAAACYKTGNGSDCADASDCSDWYNSSFCRNFGSKGPGRDLAQTILYRVVGSYEPSSYEFDFNLDGRGHPGWAVLTGLRGVDTNEPVRDWANEGCDRDLDSSFPSVYGRSGDLLLLSQSFDDTVPQSWFGSPSGMSTYGYVSQSDEAGFMFGKVLGYSGETGSIQTDGRGASDCKDGLVSLTIRAR